MIESTILVKDEMVEINLEYAKEIEEFISLIEKQQTSKNIVNSTASSSSVVVLSKENDRSHSRKTEETTGEHQSSSNCERINIHDDDTPAWAKHLWKKIALKCHPDRLSFLELTSLEIAKRQIMFTQARAAYTNRDWKKLLYYGIILDEYIDDLIMSEQYLMLETQYNTAAAKVQDIQSSIAWKWGTDWKNLQMRIQIITACCQNKGLVPPDRKKLMNMLIKFELD